MKTSASQHPGSGYMTSPAAAVEWIVRSQTNAKNPRKLVGHKEVFRGGAFPAGDSIRRMAMRVDKRTTLPGFGSDSASPWHGHRDLLDGTRPSTEVREKVQCANTR